MNKTWYAVMMNENDNDWGMGSYNKEEAIKQVKKDYPEEGWIAIIDEVTDEATGKIVETVIIDRIAHDDIFEI